MSAQLYSALLLEGPGSSSTVVPAGLLYVVRDISVTLDTNGTAAPINFLVQLNGVTFYNAAQVALMLRSYHWDGRQVCGTGATLEAIVLGTGVASYTVSGYALTTP